MRVSRIAIQKLGKHIYESLLIPVLQCDVLRDLVPFVRFKKREKRPWESVTFSKVAGF